MHWHWQLCFPPPLSLWWTNKAVINVVSRTKAWKLCTSGKQFVNESHNLIFLFLLLLLLCWMYSLTSVVLHQVKSYTRCYWRSHHAFFSPAHSNNFTLQNSIGMEVKVVFKKSIYLQNVPFSCKIIFKSSLCVLRISTL